MSTETIQVKMVAAPTSGPLNPAFVNFAFDMSTGTLVEREAQVIVYLLHAARNCMEFDASIQGVRFKVQPDSDWIDRALPFDYVNGLLADAPGWYNGVTSWTTADQQVGIATGTSSGRGDSLCVNTKAFGFGKHGRGRHFLPFLARDAVTPFGLIGSESAAHIEQGYSQLIMGAESDWPGVVALKAQVWSPSTGLAHDIAQVKCSEIPSRLRSRTH